MPTNYIIIPPILPEPAAFARAKSISQRMFRLHKPPEKDHPADGTVDLLGVIQHPEDGRVAIELPDGLEININGDLDRAGDDRKSNYHSLFPGTSRTEKDRIDGKFDDAFRNRVKIKPIDIIPAQMEVKTRQEMEAEGWFPELNP